MTHQEEQWRQWRDERIAGLREPHGWLSLINLEWVGAQPAPLESFPGIWSADDHRVTAVFTEEDGVSRDGTPVVGQVILDIPRGDSDTSLEDARGRQAEVASRFSKIAVRTRDPQASTLQNFTETDTYPYSEKWVVTGQWEKFAAPVTIAITSAHESRPMTATIAGKASLLGQEILIGGKDLDSLHLIFHDATNGETTEAWRTAPVSANGDTITVDFNRSVNFPAHFTPFGTCPTPPAGNTFTTAIEAGERKIQ